MIDERLSKVIVLITLCKSIGLKVRKYLIFFLFSPLNNIFGVYVKFLLLSSKILLIRSAFSTASCSKAKHIFQKIFY